MPASDTRASGQMQEDKATDATGSVSSSTPFSSYTWNIELGCHALGGLIAAVAHNDDLHAVDGLEQLSEAGIRRHAFAFSPRLTTNPVHRAEHTADRTGM